MYIFIIGLIIYEIPDSHLTHITIYIITNLIIYILHNTIIYTCIIYILFLRENIYYII